MASYYVWSAAAGAANGTSWTNAYTTMTAAFSGKVAGDVFYMAHDHAESTAATITLTSPGTLTNLCRVICADRAGSVPPVSADRRTTAQVSTTGASHINFAGSAHYDGIIFSAGNAANSADIRFTLTLTGSRFDNCSLRLAGSGASSSLDIGGNGVFVVLNNTTVSFTAVGQGFAILGVLKWRNTPSALLGTIPANLFQGSGFGGELECIGVDFSAAGSGKVIAANVNSSGTTALKMRFVDCKMNASVTRSQVPLAPGGLETDFVRSSASGNYAVQSHRYSGLLVEETTIVRTGGATDGTTPIAWNVTSTANCNYSLPFECPPIAIWNDTTGSAKTATIECIWGGGAVPLDNEIWVDVEYLGDASSPQGSFINDGMANLLTAAANQTSSSVTWGGSATKFKLNVTFTAQQKGWVYARVKVGKASSTFYVDPLVTLT